MTTEQLIMDILIEKIKNAGVNFSPQLGYRQKLQAVVAELGDVLLATKEDDNVWRLLVPDPSFPEDDRMQAQVMIHANQDTTLNVSIWAATIHKENEPQALCEASWADLTAPF